MIQRQTILNVADNSGAKKIMCIGIPGSNRRTATVGDIVTCVVKEAIPDDGVLSAYRVLAKDFTRTVVLAVTDQPVDTMVMFQRAGAITVASGPESPWRPAWRTAMELSWSTASAG